MHLRILQICRFPRGDHELNNEYLINDASRTVAKWNQWRLGIN